MLARIRGDSLKTGMTYSYGRLQKATSYMQDQLTKQDFVAGQVKLVGAEYEPTTNRADITFHIETGPVVKIRATGAHIWGRTMKSLVPMYAVNQVNDELIKEGQQNILAYFQKKGYFDAKVDVKVDQTAKGENITYDIHKDGRFKVKEVAIKGNQHLSSKELAPHLSVEKASWLFFSHGTYSQQLVQASAKNLKQTYRAAGYSQAEVVPTVKRDNGNVNIVFQVTEGPLNVVRNLQIVGNNTMPESEFAPKGLNLGPGKAVLAGPGREGPQPDHGRYLTMGYLNAAFHAVAKPVAGRAEPHGRDLSDQRRPAGEDGRDHHRRARSHEAIVHRQAKCGCSRASR